MSLPVLLPVALPVALQVALPALLAGTTSGCIYLSTDYFGTRQIKFGNNMNAIGDHFLDQSRGHISCIYDYIDNGYL